MNYVDVYVLPVPRKNLAAYRRMAKLAAKVWKDHGALEYVEAVADDVKPGKLTSFPQSVKLKKGETVVVGYAVFPSKKVRDKCMTSVMTDRRFAKYSVPGYKFPFDGKRMFWGGFKLIVSA